MGWLCREGLLFDSVGMGWERTCADGVWLFVRLSWAGTAGDAEVDGWMGRDGGLDIACVSLPSMYEVRRLDCEDGLVGFWVSLMALESLGFYPVGG